MRIAVKDKNNLSICKKSGSETQKFAKDKLENAQLLKESVQLI